MSKEQVMYIWHIFFQFLLFQWLPGQNYDLTASLQHCSIMFYIIWLYKLILINIISLNMLMLDIIRLGCPP